MRAAVALKTSAEGASLIVSAPQVRRRRSGVRARHEAPSDFRYLQEGVPDTCFVFFIRRNGVQRNTALALGENGEADTAVAQQITTNTALLIQLL